VSEWNLVNARIERSGPSDTLMTAGPMCGKLPEMSVSATERLRVRFDLRRITLAPNSRRWRRPSIVTRED